MITWFRRMLDRLHRHKPGPYVYTYSNGYTEYQCRCGRIWQERTH